MDPMTIAMLAGGAVQTVSGLFGQGKAKKLASEVRPEYQMAQGIIDNQALTESMASQGLSDASLQLYTTNAQRGLTRGVDAILRGGGNVNMISDLQQGYDDGLSQLAVADEQARFRNINNYLSANTALAAEQDKAWQINKYAPWADKQKLAAEMKANADKNVMGGINTMLSAGMSSVGGATNPTAGVPKTGAKLPTTKFFGSPGSADPATFMTGLKGNSYGALAKIGFSVMGNQTFGAN